MEWRQETGETLMALPVVASDSGFGNLALHWFTYWHVETILLGTL